MPLLTRENLDQSGYRYGDYNAIASAKGYLENGKISLLDFSGSSAIFQVEGRLSQYTVNLKAISRERISYACSCPIGVRGNFCKHIIAAIIYLRQYLKTDAEKDWKYRLALALEKNPIPSKSQQFDDKVVALLGVELNRLQGGEYNTSVFVYEVRPEDWAGCQIIEALNNPGEAAAYLDQNRDWNKHIKMPRSAYKYGSVINLSPEGQHVINTFISHSGYYYSTATTFFQYLPLLDKLDIPIFYLKNQVAKERLRVLNTPARVEAALTFDGQTYTLHAGVEIGGQICTNAKDNLKLLSGPPNAWGLAGKNIFPIVDAEALGMLQYLPLTIPKAEEALFRQDFFQAVAKRIPIKGDIVSWIDIREEAVSRLYLENNNGHLNAFLRFGYGDYEVDGNINPPPLTLIDIPDSWGAVRIHRRVDIENRVYSLLTDPQYGLKRSTSGGKNCFELRARMHPFDFLLHCVPNLTAAGFEIFGEKEIGKINHNRPTIRLNISSGIDWFDLNASVQYGDQEVPLGEIRKALKRGEKYVKLADGSIGAIPPEWLERYKHLFQLAEETPAGLRVSDAQLGLLDELLAEAQEAEIAPEFQRKRERLKSFKDIAIQPIPLGFRGALRPYQSAGLDWLYFLHDYGFGGILADDMGLGKTIQVLAFLQSLKENGQTAVATLLVVPKSLLGNWQREAERFTPALSIHEFMGNTRKKETAVFEAYDVILTTYGTMLRDIEFLRSYRFNYAILDESQMVKNPLSQSSKAARLLNANHRLVMTGTPVENNVYELWSQFAFTNPGLLGSLDYFKSAFGSPIENRQDDGSTQLLKRLIFPFILRRTKEQVAPELPPRSERLIFTDLEPAQRKLYNQTRDYYRSLLMGILDEGDIEDARMKILEGLLRMRQVCIHPRLIEPTFHGEAAKFEILLETLETLQTEGHKALVFSQFVQSLTLLRVEMERRHMRYAYLDGQTQKRQEEVDSFQNNPNIPFFLISLKAGGVGLNLTAADYVLHLDPWWNPAVEMQAANRAHRIGQDKPVFIYKFIARDTVEEKILELQERKKELVEQLISAEGSFFKNITKEDVKALFS